MAVRMCCASNVLVFVGCQAVDGAVGGCREVSQAGRSGVGFSSGPFDVEASPQVFHSIPRPRVLGDARLGAPPGMKHGGVVTAAETPADRRQRLVCELAGEVHGHLSRPGYTCCARGGEELVGREAELLAGGRLNLIDGPAGRMPGCR